MSNAWLWEVRYRESAGKRRAALSAPRRGPHPSVASPPPSEMVVSMFCALSLAAAIAIAAAHPHSHDNILRVQLWDAEGLSREPVTVHVTSAPVLRPAVGRSSRVDSRVLYEAMLEEGRGRVPGGRSPHHRVRHKRRRTRRSGEPASPPWQFHAGSGSINVVSYEEDDPPPESAGGRDAGAPQPQRAADEPAPDEKTVSLSFRRGDEANGARGRGRYLAAARYRVPGGAPPPGRRDVRTYGCVINHRRALTRLFTNDK